MVNMISQFLSMLTLVFAIASIIAGLFTAYFGSGKSRLVGGILVVIGLLVGLIFIYGTGLIEAFSSPVSTAGNEFLLDFRGTIVQGVVAIVGAIVGAVIALGIFLLAIMKA